MGTQEPVVIFDLDGTLVDSAYFHAVAWHEAFRDVGICVPAWRLHRRVGMSGSLLIASVLLEEERSIDSGIVDTLETLHTRHFSAVRESVSPLPGARDLLDHLSTVGIRWGIATSGTAEDAKPLLDLLGIGADVVVVTDSDERRSKPASDLFVQTAQKLGSRPSEALIVGDTVWDMMAARKSGGVGIGLLTGGYSAAELTEAQALRVYDDPHDLLVHLHEVGLNTYIDEAIRSGESVVGVGAHSVTLAN